MSRTYGIYDKDKIWLATTSAETRVPQVVLVERAVNVAAKLGHYFAQVPRLALNSELRASIRMGNTLCRSMTITLPAKTVELLDDFSQDAAVFDKCVLTRKALLHIVIARYAHYLRNKMVILTWYRNHMPHAISQNR